MRLMTSPLFLAVVALAILFSACAAEHHLVRGPDGDWWYSISCRRSQANCFDEASDICPRGYDTASESGHSGVYVNVNRYSAYAVPIYQGHLLVKCRHARPANAPPRVQRQEPESEPDERAQ